MEKLRKIIRESFDFSEREANGFIVLSGLLILVLAFPWVYRWYLLRNVSDNEQVKPQLIFEVATSHQEAERFYRKSDSLIPEYKSFDPNTVELSDLKKMGLNPALAGRLVKYREAGGMFTEKSDILRIYGFPHELYLDLEPYIQIKEPPSIDSAVAVKSPVPKQVSFDINKATPVELASVSGIGEKLSARIIKFRDRLGGFYSKDQLYEVYGLDSIVVERLLKSSFIAGDFEVRSLAVNSLSEEELASHPYCGRKAAAIIVAYRNNHGAYNGADDLRSSHAFQKGELEKLLPYLNFQ